MRLLLSVVLIFGMHLMVQGQTFDWARSSGTWVDDNGLKVIPDNNGNFYSTGHVNSGAEFGNFKAPDRGFFLAKYDSAGNTLWARFGTQSYNGIGTSLAIDSEGNIYATGSFSYTLDLGDTVLMGAHQTSIFLVKFDENGQLLWAKILGISGSNGWPFGRGLAIDDQDNIYIATNFSGDLSLEGGIVITASYPYYWGYQNIGIVKYTKNGTIVWGKGVASEYNDTSSIDLLCYNNTLYLAARIGRTFKYDNQVYSTGYPDQSSVILSFDTSGNRLWHSAFSGTISDADISPSGDLYACGIFYKDFSVDGKYDLHQTDGASAIFLLKYQHDGFVRWSKKIESGGGWPPFVTSYGENVYLAGTISTSIKVDTIQIGTVSIRDAFLLKLNDIGYAQWIRQFSSGWADDMSSISVNNKGRLTVLGHFSGQKLSIDGTDLINNSGNDNVDIFIASMKDSTPNKCPAFHPTLQKDYTLCEGQMAQLTASYSDQYTNHNLTWFYNSHKVESTDLIYKASEPGQYNYVLEAGNHCADTSNIINIIVFEKPSNSISANRELNVCDGQSVWLQADQNHSYSYQWFFNGNKIEDKIHSSLEVVESGLYRATITNGPCVINTLTQSVHITNPESNFLPDTLILCRGDKITLSPTLNSSEWNYHWSTGATTQTTSILTPGVVTMTISNDHCSFEDQVWIRLSDSEFRIPNVITPNGDGKNDALIIGKNDNQSIDLTVFNRFGNVVFKASDYQDNWSPSDLSTGTYYYSVKDQCSKKYLKGWIQVLHD